MEEVGPVAKLYCQVSSKDNRLVLMDPVEQVTAYGFMPGMTPKDIYYQLQVRHSLLCGQRWLTISLKAVAIIDFLFILRKPVNLILRTRDPLSCGLVQLLAISPPGTTVTLSNIEIGKAQWHS